jgi:hypothetical protein
MVKDIKDKKQPAWLAQTGVSATTIRQANCDQVGD